MPLSASSVFHFTKQKESLKGILEANFRPKYCLETVRCGEFDFKLFIPMVSFCDIPLSEVKTHIANYGQYGIGLSKEWAKKKGLNPVLYVEAESNVAKSLETALSEITSERLEDDSLSLDLKMSIYDIFRYIKEYQGDLTRKNQPVKANYRFSDEREWRFVPTANDCPYSLFIEGSHSESEINIGKVFVAKLHLDFEPNDIKYIIIENDSEIAEFISFLRVAKGKRYNYNDVERLTTRILTTEQILNDI